MADQSAEFVENCGFELSRTDYTPPEGYRLLQIGEVVQKDDIFLAVNGEHWPAKRIGEAVNNNRYLRRIEVEQAAVPKPESEPEPENCGFEGHILREVSQLCAPCDSRDTGDMTTSEQIAEIEGQAADYTPPEGWRVLQPGEPLQPGDAWAHPQADLFETNFNFTGVAGRHGYYLRRIEGQAEPQPVQVREGRWRTRGGEIRNVTLTPAEDLRAITYPWHDARYGQTWLLSGRYNTDHTNSELDLVAYVGPIEPEPEQQSEPQPELQQAADYTPPEGWRVLQEGEVIEAGDRWVQVEDGQSCEVQRIGRRVKDGTYIRRSEAEPQPEPEQAPQTESDAERQIRTLQEMIDAQAETIGGLHSEIHELNVEIGGLQRNHAAAVEAADKQNATLREQLDAATAELQRRHPDHVGRSISTDEWMDQFARDASVSRLQADRNDLAGKVVTLREQLQQANDRVAYLEALLPTATAYTTAQTMVRDMLGHMRCLMALQHTVNRGDFCTLLESILEMFDEAECNEDDADADADDTSDTSDTSDTTKSEQG